MFVRALAGRFFTSGEVEEEVILAAEKQVGGLGDAFVPWKFIPAISALKEVYNAFEKALRDTGYVQELPREATTDVAHSVFASNLHGAAILRELAKGTGDEDVREVIARLGRVESSLRMPIRNSSLGGLLKADNPAVTGRSIVRLMIGDVARESADVAWAFGQGDEIRRCAAEPAIIEFCTEVQKEFRRRKEE